MDRNEAIKAIRAGLKARSGMLYSVTGGTGTAWGWIHIDVPPRFRKLPPEELKAAQAKLAELLGMPSFRGGGDYSVPASTEYRKEWVARAEGRTPDVYGEPYWD